ncbi:phage tail protein [Escherichia coli]|uniref:phage tail protein n=7 Tax=Escherichia coli TaxID=562 RepID=UPI000E1E1B1D|nr:phage tail protein [Escherichia coli]MBF7296211.1 phage tail protein [Escherichia coli]
MKETKNIDTENTVVTDTVKETSERGVKLTQPIERGGEKITYVEITGAIEQAGSLRDLSLSDVLNLKAESMFTLLSRVTSPRLDEVTIKKMASRDFIQLCVVAVNFLSGADSGGKNEQATDEPPRVSWRVFYL